MNECECKEQNATCTLSTLSTPSHFDVEKLLHKKGIIAATATATAATLCDGDGFKPASFRIAHEHIVFAYNSANNSSQPLLINNSIHRGIACRIIMAITTIVDKWHFAYLSVSLLSIQVYRLCVALVTDNIFFL